MACKQKEGLRVRFVTDVDVVTNLTLNPSSITSTNLVRSAITVLSPVKSDKNVRYLPFASRTRRNWRFSVP
jgi:hypothetical protein